MNIFKSGHLPWRFLNRFSNEIAHKNVRFMETGLIDVKMNTTTGVATVSLKRPPVNGLSLELLKELSGSLKQIENDKSRGIIVTSAIPGVFTAGLDIMEMYKPKEQRLYEYWKALQDMWLNLYSSSCSTVAAISGHSPGGGCLIACSCDYRVMVSGKFGIGLNESQLGLAVPSWFIDSFRNVLPKRISEMALIEGKLFSVDEALKVGLIDEVASDNNDAIAKAEAYLKKLSRFDLTAMSHTKRLIRQEYIKRLQDNREEDIQTFIKFVTMPYVQKSLEVYLENLKKKK